MVTVQVLKKRECQCCGINPLPSLRPDAEVSDARDSLWLSKTRARSPSGFVWSPVRGVTDPNSLTCSDWAGVRTRAKSVIDAARGEASRCLRRVPPLLGGLVREDGGREIDGHIAGCPGEENASRHVGRDCFTRSMEATLGRRQDQGVLKRTRRENWVGTPRKGRSYEALESARCASSTCETSVFC